MAPASGWFARAERILDEAHLECVVRGYLLFPRHSAHRARRSGGGHAAFDQAAISRGGLAIVSWRRLPVTDAGGRSYVSGASPRVSRCSTKRWSAVIAGDVTPVLAGDIYCSVLEGCQEIFDLRRAYEWTASFAHWCATQPDLVRYRGECLLYRAEVMQLRGKWDEAAQDARDACELLMSRPAAGAAFYGSARFIGSGASSRRLRRRTRAPTSADESPSLDCRCFVLRRVRSTRRRRRSGAFCATRGRGQLAPECLPLPSRSSWPPAISRTRAPLPQNCRRSRRAFGAPLLSAASAHATGAVLLAKATSQVRRGRCTGLGNLAGSGDAVRRGAYLPADGSCL